MQITGDVEVSHFTGDDHVQGVALTNGQEIPADAGVCGTGAVPDVMLAKRAGLELGARGGVLYDAELQTSFEVSTSPGTAGGHMEMAGVRRVIESRSEMVSVSA